MKRQRAPYENKIGNLPERRRTLMFHIISRKRRIELPRFARAIGSGVATLLLASPAFAQIGGDRVSSFLSNALSYAQSLGIFGPGFLFICPLPNLPPQPPTPK